MAFNFSPRVVQSGLVLYLDAANPRSYVSGSTVWNDLTANNYNANLTNGPTYSSANGGSIVFDGVDDYVKWESLAPVKWHNWSTLTLECAFILRSYTGGTNGRQYIADFRNDTGVNGVWGLYHDSVYLPTGLKLFYTTTTGAFEDPLISTISLNSLILYQVTINKTISVNNINHYINGNNVFNRSISITNNTISTGPAWLGRSIDNLGYRWNGNIYLLRIYPNKILTQSDLLQNYNATKSRFNLT